MSSTIPPIIDDYPKMTDIDIDEIRPLVDLSTIGNTGQSNFIIGNISSLNPEIPLIEPEPLENMFLPVSHPIEDPYEKMISKLSKATFFLTIGRRFRCVCGKRTLCFSADLYQIKNNEQSKCLLSEFNIGKIKRLSNDNRKNMEKNKIENLPFFDIYNGVTFLKCRGHCVEFKMQCRKFKKGSTVASFEDKQAVLSNMFFQQV